MSHTDWGGEQNIIYKGVEAFPRTMCQPSRCSLKGGRHEAVCQRGRWGSKGGGLWCPTLVWEVNKSSFIRVWKPSLGRCASLLAVLQRGVDTRRCASEDAGVRRGVDCDVPTLVGEENKTSFIRVWKPSPSRHVLKPWGEAQRRREQYLLAVNLGRYIIRLGCSTYFNPVTWTHIGWLGLGQI